MGNRDWVLHFDAIPRKELVLNHGFHQNIQTFAPKKTERETSDPLVLNLSPEKILQWGYH
jgi:hypothetical protein